MQQLAARLRDSADRAVLGDALDELEFLYDALDPEHQELADGLMGELRDRLAAAGPG